MNKEKIIQIFEKEFLLISDKFTIIEGSINTISKSSEQYIYHPGVYVFYQNAGVIKVGRHLTNSRKRALEHIRENTKNDVLEMKSLDKSPDSRILLFNVKDTIDNHWVAALEIYLEKELNPIIKSKRQG